MRLRSTRLTAIAHAARRLLGIAAAWSPLSWFSAGEQGAWYDPTDMTRYMSVEGSPELVTNGATGFTSTAGWSASGGASIAAVGGHLRLTNAAGGYSSAWISLSTQIGRTYRVVFSLPANGRGRVGTGSEVSDLLGPVQSAAGTFIATTTTTFFSFYVNSGTTAETTDLPSVTVKEAPLISQATMYQDAAGTTPVTAVEQPVGLILDRRLGALGALGAELCTIGTFDSPTGWNNGGGAWTIAGGVASASATAGALSAPGVSATVGKTYRVEYTISGYGGGSLRLEFGGANLTTRLSNGTFVELIRATSTNFVYFQVLTAFTGTIDNVSIREVPGNHATQATSTARPTLRNRYNRILSSEAFSVGGVWSVPSGWVTENADTGSSGAMTADRFVPPAATNTKLVAAQSAATALGSNVLKIRVKPRGYTKFGFRENTSSGASAAFELTGAGSVMWLGGATATIAAVENGFYEIVATFSLGVSTACTLGLYILDPAYTTGAFFSATWASNGTDGVILDRAELLLPPDASLPYQRVTTSTDYDSDPAKFPLYLAFDGSDDSMATGSIDFSATDEMTVVAGVTKLSDVAAMLVEHSANLNGNLGTFFFVTGSDVGFLWSVAARSQDGNSRASGRNADPAPAKAVMSMASDFALPSTVMRFNGVPQTPNTLSASGNYGNYPLFIGARNSASIRFNGRIHQLIIRGKTSADIAAAETFVAAKTGATL